MELIILGSGTYQPELKRHCSSYLLRIGRQAIVFDFGRGAIDQLLKLGIHYYDIDMIFITHHHADHLSELCSFLHIALAEPYKEEKRKNKMTIYGPKGTRERVNHILAAIGMLGRKPKHEIFIEEIGDGHSVALGCCTVTGYHVVHSHQGACLAYRIESNKKVICYSGDTSYCPGLKKACMNADLAIIEASFPAKFNFEGHMTTEKTASLAKLTNVKKLVLTHISSNYLKKYDMLKEAKKFYEGPLVIAKDMMRIKV